MPIDADDMFSPIHIVTNLREEEKDALWASYSRISDISETASSTSVAQSGSVGPHMTSNVSRSTGQDVSGPHDRKDAREDTVARLQNALAERDEELVKLRSKREEHERIIDELRAKVASDHKSMEDKAAEWARMLHRHPLGFFRGQLTILAM